MSHGVYERADGHRIHTGGLVGPRGHGVMAYVHDPVLWRRCRALEPGRGGVKPWRPDQRRALMLFVDAAWPLEDR